MSVESASPRITVAKTYKLFVGGVFPRSESGRTYQVTDAKGAFQANAALASRKDARDAVLAARRGTAAWSASTAYNRGQVIYRIAEMLEGRRDQFSALVAAGEGVRPAVAQQQVDAAIDLLVHYAGWTDKLAAVFGSANPVAGPYFSFTVPEPTGVVAAVAPQYDSLAGLVGVVAPIIASGNAVVVLASTTRPLPAVTLGEVLATSDLPAGVVNILTGEAAEIMPHLAAHGDVNALDLTGCDGQLRTELATAASGTIKRVYVPRAPDAARPAVRRTGTVPGTARLRAFLEHKTVWHPTGAVSLAGGGSY
ncbi:MAG: aldehyde dehydrogenase family protein [Microbacterium sp.]